MPASPIADYLNTLRANLRASDTTERSHYPALKALIESLAADITAAVEPACFIMQTHVAICERSGII
jgi:hypothetical protein